MTYSTRVMTVVITIALAFGGAEAAVHRTNTVEGLVHLLKTFTTSSEIVELETGDYDLTGIQMEEAGSKYGESHLVISGVQLRGKGDRPEDVRLIGDGSCRVLRMIPETFARVQNLTITNGYAKTISGASDSKHGGGIYGYPTVTNCVIIGCKADGNGGGTYGYTYIRNCQILNNSASQGGGVFQPNEVLNSEVCGNNSSSHGGGIYGNGSGRVDGSTISRNTAGGAGGGICAVNTVTNSIVSLNSAQSGGGALYSWGRSTKFAYYCTICSNKTTTGGTSQEYTIIGGTNFANYAQNGGGARKCDLRGVRIHDNYATANGGGVDECTVEDCILSNNFAGSNGPNASNSTLFGCEITGTTCFQSIFDGCSFHDIGQSVSMTGNCYIDTSFTPPYVLNGYVECTNCLFYGNHSSKSDGSLFAGNSGGSRKSHLVNCTIVSNSYAYVFKYFKTDAVRMSVINSVFWGNTLNNGITDCDISWDGLTTAEGIFFSHCAYGISNVSGLESYTDGTVYKFGVNGFSSNPKFVGNADAENPFAIKRTSPLRNAGQVFDWMSGSTDIRGEGFMRLRDGKVDIGCYQCWLMPTGLKISVR